MLNFRLSLSPVRVTVGTHSHTDVRLAFLQFSNYTSLAIIFLLLPASSQAASGESLCPSELSTSGESRIV